MLIVKSKMNYLIYYNIYLNYKNFIFFSYYWPYYLLLLGSFPVLSYLYYYIIEIILYPKDIWKILEYFMKFIKYFIIFEFSFKKSEEKKVCLCFYGQFDGEDFKNYDLMTKFINCNYNL